MTTIKSLDLNAFKRYYGGKAAGIERLRRISTSNPHSNFQVPETAYVPVSLFDRFLDYNGFNRQDISKPYGEQIIEVSHVGKDIHTIKRSPFPDSVFLAIRHAFSGASFEPRDVALLSKIFERMYPQGLLIARSSSLLEDSPGFPKGLYHSKFVQRIGDFDQDFTLFMEAIRSVMASMFSHKVYMYSQKNPEVLEDRMGIVIQPVVGSLQEGVFFPHYSGVTLFLPYHPGTTMTYVNRGLNTSTVRDGSCIQMYNGKIDSSGKFHYETTTPSGKSPKWRSSFEFDCLRSDGTLFERAAINPTDASDPLTKIYINDRGVVNHIENLDRIARELKKETGENVEIEWSVHNGELYAYQTRTSHSQNNYEAVKILKLPKERIIAESEFVCGNGEVKAPIIFVKKENFIFVPPFFGKAAAEAAPNRNGYILAADFLGALEKLPIRNMIEATFSEHLPGMRGLINLSDGNLRQFPLAAHWSDWFVRNNILVLSVDAKDFNLDSDIIKDYSELPLIRYTTSPVRMAVDQKTQSGQVHLL